MEKGKYTASSSFDRWQQSAKLGVHTPDGKRCSWNYSHIEGTMLHTGCFGPSKKYLSFARLSLCHFGRRLYNIKDTYTCAVGQSEEGETGSTDGFLITGKAIGCACGRVDTGAVGQFETCWALIAGDIVKPVKRNRTTLAPFAAIQAQSLISNQLILTDYISWEVPGMQLCDNLSKNVPF